MNALTLHGRGGPLTILQDQRDRLGRSTFFGKAIADFPIVFLFKAAGGVGADIFVSMMDNCLRDAVKQAAFVLQIGGARGPVANSHPSELYKRIDLDTPDATAAMIDAIDEKFGKNPIIVMVDPNYSARLIEDLEDLSASNLRYHSRGMALVRNAKDTPKLFDHIRRVMPSWKVVVQPQFENIDPSDAIAIPRLPAIIINRIVDRKISFREALEEQSRGVLAMMLSKLNTFNLMMEGVYVHS